MGQSIKQESREIGKYVAGKVLMLQNLYLSKSSSALGRARLARLRRLSAGGGSGWVEVGDDVFADLPELGLGDQSDGKMVNAVVAALRTYAFHQQSKTDPMAMTWERNEGRDAAGGGPRRRSFGWSCRQIETNYEDNRGVRRRLAALETASSFDVLESGVRALARLMRGGGVQIDYGLLAADFYLLQFDVTRGGVFQRWSKDYFSFVPKGSGEDAVKDIAEEG